MPTALRHLLSVLLEETGPERRFGEACRRYKADVPRRMPHIGRR